MSAAPLDNLRAEVAAGHAVAVVGARVSSAATGNAPVASWARLLQDDVAYCERLLGPSRPPTESSAAGPSSCRFLWTVRRIGDES